MVVSGKSLMTIGKSHIDKFKKIVYNYYRLFFTKGAIMKRLFNSAVRGGGAL